MHPYNPALKLPFMLEQKKHPTIHTVKELIEQEMCVMCRTTLYSATMWKTVKMFFVIFPYKRHFVNSDAGKEIHLEYYCRTDFYTTKKAAMLAGRQGNYLKDSAFYAGDDPIIHSIEHFFKQQQFTRVPMITADNPIFQK